ncbi:uncharacterized protein EHS24_002369 [Apiotrichum porosum]|uniref:CFEM domain-containing protein n=1 Tax=Apiotrichum porosum TaxID=105984 RepID=A0A427XIE4_9TREE|nr:uncharacterized protein EHS24_002369 [Apiotrichum porosum]RSH78640.1 hypothetical protein EHS24_002369 [Apiotrichum porosum]
MKLSALALCVAALATTARATAVADLSACAQACLEAALVSTGCEAECDGACVCSTDFTTNATPCVLACGITDALQVLDVQSTQCSMGTIETCTAAATSTQASATTTSSAAAATSSGCAEYVDTSAPLFLVSATDTRQRLHPLYVRTDLSRRRSYDCWMHWTV